MKNFKEVFEASHNSDATEGRGYKVHVGYFTNRRDATRAVQHRGPMGTQGDVEVVSLAIYDSFEEFEQMEQEKLRVNALKKLTYEERVVLGLHK